ncbi:hypothetical protein MRB53_040595 [Persea americana]|nr:hypothetical protein MRB53_040595 [Persea americana]
MAPRPSRLLTTVGLVALFFVLYSIFFTTSPVPNRPEKVAPGSFDPFAYKDPNLEDNPNSDRINAAIITLVRNSELETILYSIRDLERTWNHKFNYPWMFFNDEEFTDEFKEAVQSEINAKCTFHIVPPEHWIFQAGLTAI